MAFPLRGERSKMYLGESIPLTGMYRIIDVSELIPKTGRIQKSGFSVHRFCGLVGLYKMYRVCQMVRTGMGQDGLRLPLLRQNETG